jgi:CspA family cold shock protein
MDLGTVTFFKNQGGFGFIQPADGSEDVFFHASSLPGKTGSKSIEEGVTVTFERTTRHGKPVARRVTPIKLGNDEVEEQPTSENEVGNVRS